jgi:hypothetical protein
MEMHGKENIRLYWRERKDHIHQEKQKEDEKNSQLF